MATLIGDLVGSRRSTDRSALHSSLRSALDDVNAAFVPTVPLRITVGDEYQGCFASLGDALRAALRLRLALLPDQDVRHGLSWGPVELLEAAPRVEDGPAWWAAREAIDEVHRAGGRPGSRTRRTGYRAGDAAAPAPGPVNAALILLDRGVGRLDDRSTTLLRGLLAGRTQRELAEQLTISASAVSQRVRADGLTELVEADAALGEV